MSRFRTSIPPSYFDAKYADDPDPWRFAASDYERDKYAATLAALPRPHYRSVLEIGCSIGVLTRQLAARCDALLGLDVAEAALQAARRRCAATPHVRFARMHVPADWPDGGYDLALLSEVVYYLDETDVRALGERVGGSLRPGGDIILVHWLGETHYPLSGDEAADTFIEAVAPFTTVTDRTRTEDYRLDILRATP